MNSGISPNLLSDRVLRGKREARSIPLHLRQRLEKEAWRFDIYGLIDLLLHMGFGLNEIDVVGHQGFESQPSFIKSVGFSDSRVEICLYFGLAGANGVIPTYLFKMAENGDIADRHFSELIRFFDHYLLKNWLRGMMPELTLSGVAQTRWLRAMQNFRSPSSLHWLFTQIFPDLQVRLTRKTFNLSRATRPAVLGKSKIGIELILGEEFRVLANGYEILLIAESEHYKPNHPWHTEIRNRFNERIRSVLVDLDIYIEVWMILRSTESWFRIKEEGNHLGYDRLKGSKNEFTRILIYTGYIKASEGTMT